jgi:hypothetical protein
MTLLSRFLMGNFAIIVLLSLFLLAIVLPFWVSQRVFQLGVWRTTPHEPADRVWVALLAATIQLALEFVGLHAISPGKLSVTVVYAFICSFGAVSIYKQIPPAFSTSRRPTTDEEEALRGIRKRIWISSTMLFACGELIQFTLEQTSILGWRTALYLFFTLVSVAGGAYFFCFVHARCPKCDMQLSRKTRRGPCPSCGLNDG